MFHVNYPNRQLTRHSWHIRRSGRIVLRHRERGREREWQSEIKSIMYMAVQLPVWFTDITHILLHLYGGLFVHASHPLFGAAHRMQKCTHKHSNCSQLFIGINPIKIGIQSKHFWFCIFSAFRFPILIKKTKSHWYLCYVLANSITLTHRIYTFCIPQLSCVQISIYIAVFYLFTRPWLAFFCLIKRDRYLENSNLKWKTESIYGSTKF